MSIDWKNVSIKDLAGYLSQVMKKAGIAAVLVGGACVTIYSKNRYQSYDLDFITYEDFSKVKKVLLGFGFDYKSRCFSRKDCSWSIEQIDFQELERWLIKEGFLEKFHEFERLRAFKTNNTT